jgi:hypothetical protein
MAQIRQTAGAVWLSAKGPLLSLLSILAEHRRRDVSIADCYMARYEAFRTGRSGEETGTAGSPAAPCAQMTRMVRDETALRSGAGGAGSFGSEVTRLTGAEITDILQMRLGEVAGNSAAMDCSWWTCLWTAGRSHPKERLAGRLKRAASI